VDDHGVDVALLEDAVEHGLEPGSVGRVLGAAVVVDVLIDHDPALLADELEAASRWAGSENPSSVSSRFDRGNVRGSASPMPRDEV